MSETPETIVDLIRHGQPVGGDRIRGWRDDPLSEEGWQAMRDGLEHGSGWSHVVTSPLLRCREFATEFARQHDLPLTVDAGFKEIGYGAWEGATRAEVMARDGDRLPSFWRDPLGTEIPGGEPFAAFEQRVREAWGSLLETHAGGHVLLVAHAGVIRTLIAHVLSMPETAFYRLDVPKAGVSRVRVDDERGDPAARLLFHGSRL